MKRLSEFDTYAIDVKKVYVDREFNCRGYFTLESVSDLAESIKSIGLQFPVVVQPYTLAPGFEFRLVAGHRRYAACTTFLNWETIPGQVRADLTEEQAALLNFTENLERDDLNILQEARALERCYPTSIENPLGCREIEKLIHRPTRWINARRALIRLPEEVQQMAAAGWLKQSNIEVLARIDDPKVQIEGAKKIAATRQSGKNRSMTHLPTKFTGNFKYRKTKEQIYKLNKRMLGEGVYGLAPRVALWCAGKLTDAEIDEDIQERLREQERLEQAEAADD